MGREADRAELAAAVAAELDEIGREDPDLVADALALLRILRRRVAALQRPADPPLVVVAGNSRQRARLKHQLAARGFDLETVFIGRTEYARRDDVARIPSILSERPRATLSASSPAANDAAEAGDESAEISRMNGEILRAEGLRVARGAQGRTAGRATRRARGV